MITTWSGTEMGAEMSSLLVNSQLLIFHYHIKTGGAAITAVNVVMTREQEWTRCNLNKRYKVIPDADHILKDHFGSFVTESSPVCV